MGSEEWGSAFNGEFYSQQNRINPPESVEKTEEWSSFVVGHWTRLRMQETSVKSEKENEEVHASRWIEYPTLVSQREMGMNRFFLFAAVHIVVGHKIKLSTREKLRGKSKVVKIIKL